MRLQEFKELTKADIDAMETSDIKSLVQYGARVLNPRINRLYHKGAELEDEGVQKIATDAYEYIGESGGLFSTVGDSPRKNKDGTLTWDKSRRELKKELKREIRFANMRTSTITGAREVQQEREQIVADNYSDTWEEMSQEERNQAVSDEWESFKKFRKRHPNVPSNVLLEIYISCNGMSKQMEDKVKEWEYAEQQKWQQAYQQAEEQSDFRPNWDFNDFSNR